MKTNEKPNIVLVVAGSTASGKSYFALKIAKACNGVIINADSMQVYDDLHMLTAHPSKEEQLELSHHLYGVLDVDELCSAAKWRDMALDVVTKAHKAGQLPVVTGGTGFYLKTMMEGLSPIPEIPMDIRENTVNILDELGVERFASELAKRDSEIAKRIDMKNNQRMIRAWEVLEATGKSLAYWQDLPKEGVPENTKFIKVVLSPKREKLYQRCNERFEWMVDNGALEEVLAFKTRIDDGEIALDAPLTRALGFWELSDYLSGKISKEEAIEKAQQSTRRYAKKQNTWFRNQMKDTQVIFEMTDDNVKELINRLLV